MTAFGSSISIFIQATLSQTTYIECVRQTAHGVWVFFPIHPYAQRPISRLTAFLLYLATSAANSFIVILLVDSMMMTEPGEVSSMQRARRLNLRISLKLLTLSTCGRYVHDDRSRSVIRGDNKFSHL